MTGTAGGLACAADGRRSLVRAAGLNGIDCVEVSEDRVHVCLHFIVGVPEGLRLENLRIEGGRQVRDIRLLSMRVRPPGDTDDEECLELTLDRAGDPSTYRVCVVEVDDRGRPTGRPYPGIDQRYACACFTFTVDCPSTLDCLVDDDCPEPAGEAPAIDYLARDYPGFRRLLLDRMALLVPDWRERHVPDLGVTLIELLAYVADHLAYAQDAVATEAYLGTARRRISVRRHVRLVDYVLGEGCNARAFVTVRVEGAATFAAPAGELRFLTPFPGAPPVGTLLDADTLPAGPYECFEPVAEDPTGVLTFSAAHNGIPLWTWGDSECCLAAGTTRAWLVDGMPRPGPGEPAGEPAVLAAFPAGGGEVRRVLDLAPGDLLLLEEVLGPRTGNPADADPARRHVVRLTRVTPVVDELVGQPLLEVEWDEDDALPFPLCLSSLGPPPACRPVDGVSVARGNVVLVDHGCPVGPEELDPVPDRPADDCCVAPCQPGDVVAPTPRYRPRPLARRPVTFAARPEPGGAPQPASALLAQDARQARAQVWLWSAPADPSDDPGPPWEVRPDLLRSGPDDRHLVVEVDDDGAAHVRLGDDRLGEGPEPGARFTARYRVGNGTAGNVGADTITYVARAGLDEHGVTVSARNPLPASGGTDPESTALAKLLAPGAFGSRLERAVVVGDYAALAGRDVPELQGAAATLRWTGSWYEVLVAVDQRGRTEPEAEVLDAVARRLERYRRMGHDVAVAPAHAAALDVRLSVCVAPHHRRADVEAALRRTFSSRVNRDGTRGWFHADNHLPGGSIAASALVAAAQAVEGVESAEVVTLRRLYDPDDVPARPDDDLLRLGPLEVARADSDPVNPDHGAVAYGLRGGR